MSRNGASLTGCSHITEVPADRGDHTIELGSVIPGKMGSDKACRESASETGNAPAERPGRANARVRCTGLVMPAGADPFRAQRVGQVCRSGRTDYVEVPHRSASRGNRRKEQVADLAKGI